MPNPAEVVEAFHADLDEAAAKLRKAKAAYRDKPTPANKAKKAEAGAAAIEARTKLRNAARAAGPAFSNYAAKARQ